VKRKMKLSLLIRKMNILELFIPFVEPTVRNILGHCPRW
jgi:hypothetical protein